VELYTALADERDGCLTKEHLFFFGGMELFLQQLVSLVDVKPSAFVHIVTESDRVNETPEMIDEMAELGKFPKLIDLWPSIIVAIALSLCRMALQRIVFKVISYDCRSIDDLCLSVCLWSLLSADHHKIASIGRFRSSSEPNPRQSFQSQQPPFGRFHSLT
jgi:hypothetical protein